MRQRAASLAVWAGLLLSITSLAGPASSQTPPARPFDPVGRWRFFHTDGTPFIARLTADQHADTNWEGGEHGIWRWEGSAVRVIYTDGWDDLLAISPDGTFTKRGWSPEADRCRPASNDTRAEHISKDSGTPL